jgi:hypothetical protein
MEYAIFARANLFNNQLTGPLPTFGRPTLKVLYLQNNRFSGSLPSGMGGLTNMSKWDNP